MKRITLAIALCVGLMVMGLPTTSHAIPELQIYIEGATYDSSSETWVTGMSDFNLWVMGNVAGADSKGPISGVVLALSLYGTGSITMTGTTTSLVTDPSSAVDPVSTGGTSSKLVPNGISGHEEYQKADSHTYYNIGNFELTDSPMADMADMTASPLNWTPNKGQINVYSVHISGYDMVHFDAYDTYYSPSGGKAVFAPPSHDGSGVPVPEPGTLLLLGFGLAGLYGYRLRKRG